MRKTKFQNEYYYHIYNRGVDKREIFCDGKDYLRFLRGLREFNQINTIESLYRNDQLKRQEQKETEFLRLLSNRRNSVSSPPLIQIISYCLNPNHYHLLLKQKQENGVIRFMHKVGLAYTKYFNNKYKRSGSLFQGKYKLRVIKTEGQLLYTSAYINGNSEIHKIKKAISWQYSSYLDYLGKRPGTLV